LTTAASIWASAAIGLSVGVGDMSGAVGLTVLVVVALHVLDPVEAMLTGEREMKRVAIQAEDSGEILSAFDALVRRFDMETRNIGINRDLQGRRVEINAIVVCSRETDVTQFLQEAAKLPGVTRVQLE
jgi:putative Mg2+ transporter-C (MgtC) family protein